MARLRPAFLAACSLLAAAGAAHAQTTLLSEDFDNVAGLSGWSIQNLSNALGPSSWFQGNDTVFVAHAGASDAYIAANFDNAADGPDIDNVSNWLITPTVTFENGDTISFFTRSVVGSEFPDRLELRLSTNGSSTDVGTSDSSVGDFTTLLLEINPTLAVGGYPEDWTEFSVNITGLGGPTAGRLGFRYFVTDSGPAGLNGDYIGVDTLRVSGFRGGGGGEAPEPGTLALAAAGLLGGAVALRRRRA